MNLSAPKQWLRTVQFASLSIIYMCLSACQSVATYNALSDKDKVLFLPQSERGLAFTEMEKYSDVGLIKSGSAPSPLKSGSQLSLSGDLDDYFDAQHLAGLIVLHKGEIRLEKYANNLNPGTNWSSFSIAKSISSTLVGAAIQDGYIKGADDLLTDYIPELAGSAYDDVTIRHLLTMTSGVKWNENYGSPKSEVAKFIRHKPSAGENSVISFMRTLERARPLGTRFNYSTGEANLIGLLVSKATGKTLSTYLSEKIWIPYGMESDALWALDQDGEEIGGCCISARLRDYARFGQFILDGGKINGVPIVPKGWIETATTSQHIFAENQGYGYLWWTYPNQTYAAKGIFGQQIGITPTHDYLIVTLSNWPTANGDANILINRRKMYRDIVNTMFDE